MKKMCNLNFLEKIYTLHRDHHIKSGRKCFSDENSTSS